VVFIRVRRFSVLLLATVALLGTASAASKPTAPTRPGLHPIPAAVPALHNAVALGTLVAIDRSKKLAEFRVKCGWYTEPKRKVHHGLWKVSLHGLAFEWESYPNGPASGIAHTESLSDWERVAVRRGWSGSLHLSSRNGFFTDGPTTDICAGVLG
jgi:hypothetical protein